MTILLVGSGNMAIEYAKVLTALNVEYTVIGRGEESAKKFEAAVNKKVTTGGLEKINFEYSNQFTHAIVATTLESLQENTLFLLENGVKNILIEKPGAVSLEGIQKIKESALVNHANVYIAYNRRFYSSVIEAQKRIKADGGLTSFTFEFTEWSHVIASLNKTSFQLENWFIGNSTHVMDTAFYLGGQPKELKGFKQSQLEWHPQGSIFVGSGITNENILFSYHANWKAPGSWKLEFLTKNYRYIFRPLEQLHIQKLGSTAIEKIEIDDSLDLEYKPGIYKQVEKFLFELESKELLNTDEAQKNFSWYEKILEK